MPALLSKIRRHIVRIPSTPHGRFALIAALLLATGATEHAVSLAGFAWTVATWPTTPTGQHGP